MSQIYGIYNYGSDDGIFCGRQCSLFAYLDMKFAEINVSDTTELNNGIKDVAKEVRQIHSDVHTLATKHDVACASKHIICHVDKAREEIVDKIDVFEKLYAECDDINQKVQDIHKHCCC